MLEHGAQQPELFGEFQQVRPTPWWGRRWRFPQRFVVLRVAYEDLVLAAVGALMVIVLGFCAGVERGRSLVVASAAGETPAAVSTSRSAAPLAVPAVAIPVMPTTPAGLAPRPAMPRPPLAQPSHSSSATKVAQNTPAPGGRYVVQVASFADRPSAEAAQRRVTQQGVQGTVAAKGRYYVLYASGFSTYAQATAAATQLRSAYQDCFVRKLTGDSRG